MGALREVWTNTSNSDSVRFYAINTFYKEVSNSAPEEALALFEYHSQLALEKNNRKEIAKAIENKAYVLSVYGKYDEAILEMKKVVKIAEALNDQDYLAAKLSNLGSIHYYRSEYVEAMRNYGLSKEILQKDKSTAKYADVVNNMGLIYFSIRSWEAALEKFHEALENYKNLNVEQKNGAIWLNIGMVHLEKGDVKEALQFARKSYPILQASNNSISLADCHHLFAKAYKSAGELDSATYHLLQSIQLNKMIGNPIKMLAEEIEYLDLVFEKNPTLAITMAEKLLNQVKQSTENGAKKDFYLLLYKCYKQQGATAKALTMHEEYLRYKDSLSLENDEVLIIREEIQRDFESRLLTAKLASTEAQANLKLRNLHRTYVLGFLGLLSIIGVFFIFRYRLAAQKKYEYSLLKEIEALKNARSPSTTTLAASAFQLNREKIEEETRRKLNETDWKVLNILLDDPVKSNKDIADLAFLSIDGIGSSLRRMYDSFDIKESKYKKISLIMKAVKLSNQQ